MISDLQSNLLVGRRHTILQNEFPYSITARCINRDWFALPLDQVWSIFLDELKRVVAERRLLVHAFVLMSNHFHLIASTPDSNISECMQLFMQRSSRRLTHAGNRINQTYGGRHYKCIMQTTAYFLNAYKYVYRNPVRAGVCAFVEEYPYSTLQAVIGRQSLPFRLAEDTTFLSDPSGTLAWLNTAPDESRQKAFRNGTRHQFFKSAKAPGTNKLILGTDDLL